MKDVMTLNEMPDRWLEYVVECLNSIQILERRLEVIRDGNSKDLQETERILRMLHDEVASYDAELVEEAMDIIKKRK